MPDRVRAEAIFLVLSTGCQWNALSRSGHTVGEKHLQSVTTARRSGAKVVHRPFSKLAITCTVGKYIGNTP